VNRRDRIAQESVTTLPHEPKFPRGIMAGATGLEPATFGVTGHTKSNGINGRCKLFGGRNRRKTEKSCNRESPPDRRQGEEDRRAGAAWLVLVFEPP
jgi:hypothetical protein